MNVGKRTILYLVRKWSKTLLLFMIFLVVGTLVISGVSIRKAADQAAANVRQSLGGGFVMKEDHSDQSKYERRDLGNGSYAMAYVGESLTKEISDKVQQSFRLRKEAKRLLDNAIKAVETAIETDEETALNLLVF